MNMRYWSGLLLAMMCTLAVHAAPAPWVIALDKAWGDAPLALVIREGAGEVYLSPDVATPVTADVAKLAITETALTGTVTVRLGEYALTPSLARRPGRRRAAGPREPPPASP